MLAIKKVGGIQEFVTIEAFEAIFMKPATFGGNFFCFINNSRASWTSNFVICGLNFLSFDGTHRFGSFSTMAEFAGITTFAINLTIAGVKKIRSIEAFSAIITSQTGFVVKVMLGPHFFGLINRPSTPWTCLKASSLAFD